MKYEAVIFDLFGTLVDMFPYNESDRVLGQMADTLSVPPDDFINLWHDTFDERMKGTLRSYPDCLRHICRRLGTWAKDSEIELAARIRSDLTERELAAIRDGAVEVLSYLKSNGYKTGLISDCSIESSKFWVHTPLAPLIDVAVLSCLEGISKSDPAIFRIAVEKLGVEPDVCLYIADGMGRELAYASELGMHACRISTATDRTDDPYREDWQGPVISTLQEVLTLVK